jgi:hypothetical protein
LISDLVTLITIKGAGYLDWTLIGAETHKSRDTETQVKFTLTYKFLCDIFPKAPLCGELAEWSKAHDWKSCNG